MFLMLINRITKGQNVINVNNIKRINKARKRFVNVALRGGRSVY